MRSGDIALILLGFALIILLSRWHPTEIFAILYHPVTGLVLTIMIVEFLWLKSTDRTRIYRLESDRLRRLRAGDEALLRRAAEVLRERTTQVAESDADWAQRASEVARDIESRP